ncbi:Protein sex-lethal [Cytospora mali]|uniref:Protein sex-lethal n=1 Tax=Cytospora mali TaxID=578113 RepID=A0A194WE61_CYTMA|nr:Protein sex-lethal [Valsa mali]
MQASRSQQDETNPVPRHSNRQDGPNRASQSSASHRHGPEPDDPFNQNAALWLNHLPRDCTVRQLIRAIISIGPTGRILFCKIVRPYLPGHSWAAKIVFATRQEAQRLLDVSRSGRLLVQGQRVFVDWHRVLSTSFQAVEPITRVLVIEGPSYIVNRPGLQDYFRRRLTRFNTEQVVELGGANSVGQHAGIVWRFGSWFGQAQVAAEALQEDYAGLVDVRYGPDPCAFPPPDGFAP